MGSVKRAKRREFQSIVCAVDFSPQSAVALQAAAQIARQTGGHVTALSVEDPMLGQAAAAVGYDTARLRQQTLVQLQRLMERVGYPAGLTRESASIETALGQPAATIIAVAKRTHADLIVMGTHGRRGAGKLLFGSTAEGVLRRAPAPVLIVPRSRSRRAQAAITRRVTGAIDLGPEDRDDARRMSDVATALGARLTLVHVVPSIPGPSWLGSRLAAVDSKRLVESRRRLEALTAVDRNGAIDGRVALGRPSEEIPALALDAKGGLVMLVLRRGRGFFGPRQGTTTYQVICGSSIPVLALTP